MFLMPDGTMASVVAVLDMLEKKLGSFNFRRPPIGRLLLVTRRNTPSLIYLYTVHLERVTEKVKP